jgi:hypothetical protein
MEISTWAFLSFEKALAPQIASDTLCLVRRWVVQKGGDAIWLALKGPRRSNA